MGGLLASVVVVVSLLLLGTEAHVGAGPYTWWAGLMLWAGGRGPWPIVRPIIIISSVSGTMAP